MADCGVCTVHWAPGGIYRRCDRLLPASSGPCSERFDRHAWSLNINTRNKKARTAEEKNHNLVEKQRARILTRLVHIYRYISIPNNPSIIKNLLLNQSSAANLTNSPSGDIVFCTATIRLFLFSVNVQPSREKECNPYRGSMILRKIQCIVLYTQIPHLC